MSSACFNEYIRSMESVILYEVPLDSLREL